MIHALWDTPLDATLDQHRQTVVSVGDRYDSGIHQISTQIRVKHGICMKKHSSALGTAWRSVSDMYDSYATRRWSEC